MTKAWLMNQVRTLLPQPFQIVNVCVNKSKPQFPLQKGETFFANTRKGKVRSVFGTRCTWRRYNLFSWVSDLRKGDKTMISIPYLLIDNSSKFLIYELERASGPFTLPCGRPGTAVRHWELHQGQAGAVIDHRVVLLGSEGLNP